MANHYAVNEKDIRFVLYEHLRIQDLGQMEPFAGLGREDFDQVLNQSLKLAQQVLAPLHELSDREGMKFDRGQVTVPREFHQAYRKFCEGGWIAVSRNPEYGGGGLPTVMRMMTLEFFEGSCVAFAIYPGLGHGVGHLVESFGDEEMKALYTERLYRGEWGGTMCLTEPQAGSALADVKTTAQPVSDRIYKIKGQKQFISCGEHDLTPNIIHMVLARIEGAPAGVRGISLFLVPKRRVGPDGSLCEPNDVACIAIEKKMGLHGSPTCQLSFGENDNCLGLLVGEPHMGLPYMFQMMNEARISVGIQALGQAAAAYEQALAYCKERIQGPDIAARKGPNVPIIRHPDVRRMLLSMKSTVEGLRALIYLSGYYYDLARIHPNPAERERYENLLEILTPVCKAYASDQGFRVNETALQCLAGYGYTSDYPIEQFLRDAKITSIYEGTNGIQALDLLGRKVVMKEGAAWKALVKEIETFLDQNQDHPALGAEVELLAQALSAMIELTSALQERSRQDLHGFALAATPYLECMGDLIVSWLLLDQAVIAHTRLQEEGADQEFYQAKLITARYFAQERIPLGLSRAQVIGTGHRFPMEMRESAF
ncbi:MAG: hypothetical protein A2V67_08140 [Deltaproteobacteria bacterium RBG_13_61_14]|nr:MAG: hypothetical protein A2V67_08140 [Deltaproteobacteria bacterium RBG_13_61_14]